MPVAALEDLLFVLVLEADVPLAVRNVVLANHSESRVTLQTAEYNDLVVHLDGAMLVACLGYCLAGAWNLHFGPNAREQVEAPQVLEELEACCASEQV